MSCQLRHAMWNPYFFFWLLLTRRRQKNDEVEKTESECLSRHISVMKISQKGVLKLAKVVFNFWQKQLIIKARASKEIYAAAVSEHLFQVGKSCHSTRNLLGGRYLKLSLSSESVQVCASPWWRVFLLFFLVSSYAAPTCFTSGLVSFYFINESGIAT